jgi:hypothetical protein
VALEECQQEISRKNELTHSRHNPIHSNGMAHCSMGQAVHLMRQSQHLQGNTSLLECKNQFGVHYGIVKNHVQILPNQIKST